MRGVNRFGQGGLTTKRAHSSGPVVFVSHSSKDKQAARIVVERLKSREVDVYFDEEDRCLATVAGSDRDQKIVGCIQQGIRESTHTLCLLSVNSLRSAWVPYEIGYAAREGNSLAVLVLSEVENPPSFIKVADHVLVDIYDLERFVLIIKNEPPVLLESVRKEAGFTDLPRILPPIRTGMVFADSGS